VRHLPVGGMSLRSRLALVALVYVLLFAIGGAGLAWSFRSWNQDLDARRDHLVASSQAAQLETAYLDQETGQRGYVITGEAAFLEPYRRGQAEASRLLDRLSAGVVGQDRRSSSAVTDVIVAADTWLHAGAEPVVLVRERDGPGAAAAMLTDGTSGKLFDALRTRLTTLQATIDAGVRRASAAAEQDRRQLVMTLVLLLGGVVGVTGVVAGLLQRWVVRPLRGIGAAATRVAQGERVSISATGPPELVDVARAVEDMQRTMVDQRDAAVRGREAVEQNAVLALQLRSELASDLGVYPRGWSVAAGLRPAEGYVAGDCYDVTLLGPQRIGVVVVDISGHGALSAIGAFKCKELLKAALRSGLEPGACLEWLTGQELGLDDSFFTAVIVAVDTASGECRYANAGHPPALVVGATTVASLLPTGPLFGYGRQAWTTASTFIEPGSILGIYTDGLTETRHHDRTFYGEDRLAEVLGTLRGPDAHRVVQGVLDDLTTFRPGRLADDVTLVVLARDE
jgi:CHASE3 domain sensor protein